MTSTEIVFTNFVCGAKLLWARASRGACYARYVAAAGYDDGGDVDDAIDDWLTASRGAQLPLQQWQILRM